MKRLSPIAIVIAALLSCSVSAYAQSCSTGSCTASSCAESAVLAALPNSSAPSSVTVAIPAGTCTWTSGIVYTIPSNVTSLVIDGAGAEYSNTGGASTAGTNETVLTDEISSGASELNISASSGQYVEVTGIAFIQPSSGGTATSSGMVQFGGTSTTMRLDHCYFYSYIGGNKDLVIYNYGGVADHDYFNALSGIVTNDLGIYNGTGWDGLSDSAGFGNASWSVADNFGTSQFFFAEDDLFNNGGVGDCSVGGRFVVRHSTSSGGSPFYIHGISGSPYRGCRAAELYDNTFSSTSSDQFGGGIVEPNSGAFLVWGNTTTYYANVVDIAIERQSDVTYPETPPPNGWGYCGTAQTGVDSVWDGNYNTTTGYPCIDSPGRGKGDLITGSAFPDILDSVTDSQTWPNQALDPIYVWDNTYNAAGFDYDGIVQNSTGGNLSDNLDYYQQFGVYGESGSNCTASSGCDITVGINQTNRAPVSGSSGDTCTEGTDPMTSGAAPGVGWWDTANNTLYVCNPTNTWTAYYTPYTYPDPLTMSGGSGGGTSGSGSSVTSGSGGSLGCAGFLPVPCARSDRMVTQLGSAPSGNVDGTWTDNGPQVNAPWINDFGEREVRATDGMIPGGKPVGGGNYGPETWWTNYWSVYDSSFGGYYWYTPIADTGESDGGTERMYQFNPLTMQSTPVCSTWTNCQMPYAGSWSLVTPGLMYYSTGEDLCSWNYDTGSGSGTCSDDAGTLVFNFSTCPDYGTYYSGSIFLDGVSYGDTWLQASFGASTMAVYNTSTDSCYWYSTRYGLVGGTSLSAESASLAVATPPSVSSATLTPVTGTGSVPSGTYYVALTMVAGTSGYETTPSVLSSPATLSGTGEIEISGQVVGSGNSFYTDNFSVTCNVYAGPSSSTLYEQSTPSASITEFSITSDVVTLTASNAFVAGEEVEVTGLSVGTYLNGQTLTVLSTGLSSSQFEADFTHANVSTTSDSGTAADIKSCSTPTAVVSYTTTGSAPPTLNGGGYPLHGSTAGTGNWMNAEVTGTGGGAYVLWEPGTDNTILCKTKDNDQCEGHESVGASNIFYNLQSPNTGGVMSPYDVALSPNADPTESNYEHLIPTGPPTYNFYAAIPSAGCNISDYHSNWTYDNPTDTLPIMWSDFVEPFVGMVAQSGTVSTTAESATVTGSGTSFSSSWVGEYVWIGTGGEQGAGLGVGVWAQIASVQSTTQLTLSAGAPLTVSGDDFWTYYYPLMGTHCTWDHEIDMVSSSGNGTVWRFAHNRASGLQNQLSNADSSYQALSMPVCSPDGKYCLWATDWANANGQGQLGTQTGMWHGSSGNPSAGCYTSCTWTGSTSYAADQEIIDSNGNEEMATTGGTSGSTEPSWPTTVNGTVSDGGVTWEMSPGCNTPQSTSVGAGGPDDGAGMCRTDIFIVEMK